MNNLHQPRGNHTWDIIIDYVLCPSCGYIIENRQKYQKRGTEFYVEIKCPRCHQQLCHTRTKEPDWAARLLE
jgi:ssDNA-binding Zn-finger/Zn-ribbon topoisomerase 1